MPRFARGRVRDVAFGPNTVRRPAPAVQPSSFLQLRVLVNPRGETLDRARVVSVQKHLCEAWELFEPGLAVHLFSCRDRSLEFEGLHVPECRHTDKVESM